MGIATKNLSFLLTHSVGNAALRQPDHTAFRCADRSLTFAQLVEQMNQLACLLQELGVKKGDRVGIYLNRSLETAVAIYGILQAGAVYVPLDPNSPSARTAFLLQDCQIRYLISHPVLIRNLKKLLAEPVQLEAIIGVEQQEAAVRSVSWETLQQMPANKDLKHRVISDDLAYIMYTSGSTGTPKGIMHTHYSGLSYARLSAQTYGLDHTDRIANHAPIHFDISTLGYFTAPFVGATTIIVPDAHTKMPASLSQLMEAERLTVWYSVPLALIQLYQRGILESRGLSDLRWVLYGGETFAPKYLRALMERWPQARFSNVYGPAEVNQCTYYHLEQAPENEEPIPLGSIWEDTEMLILDENDREVEQGAVGELLIRSATMMRGYWNRPDLTEKGFYRRTVIPGFSETFYRTGDLVKLDESGKLQFFGRKDQQIKTRGYRVELESVENLLAAIKEVSEAVVFPYRTPAEEVLIMAAVLLRPDSPATEKDFLRILKDQLPSYALPQRIFIVDAFPRTGTGKTDRPELKKKLLEKIAESHG